MNLFYNPETKIIFASDADQPSGIQAITKGDIADLIANGATVDSSADSLLAPLGAGNAVGSAPAPDASATNSDTGEAPVANTAAADAAVTSAHTGESGVMAEAGNVFSGTEIAGSASDTFGTVSASASTSSTSPTNTADTTTSSLSPSAPADPVVGTLAVPPVTPTGDSVAQSQPTAVSVEGYEDASLKGQKPASSYEGADHSTLLGRLLEDLEGAVHMGKSEIIGVIDRARAALRA